MAKMIGIDLGTTNSCTAVMEGGSAVIIPARDGSRTTPSVVAFTKNGERLIGSAAKRQAVANSKNTVTSIKREMGTDYRVNVDGKSYTPPEISAMILSELKEDAEAYLGESVRDAVITVPAYFSDAQRQATKDAGTIAGLNVLRIINEPTAAAVAYGLDKEGPAQKIMVYDLGGGTFDVSVLDINNGVIEVLATAGNNRLGGDDFDAVLTDYILDAFYSKERIDLKKDPAALQRVREAAEKAKIELSDMQETTVMLPFIAMSGDTPKNLELSITRAKFNALTAHLVEKTRGPVNQALQDAGLTPSSLSKVILVGGSTRIPAVQELIKQMTGKAPFKGINPDECVAMGAAVQSGVLSGTVKGLLLLDVTPLSLGVETVGDHFAPIIARNTSIPIKKSQIFTTAAPFQSSVDIKIYQGERERASGNKLLGNFRLSGIRRAMAGVPQIEVTFDIDSNGIVHVSAKDLSNGQQQEITITGSGNLSDAEIRAAMADAARYKAEDDVRAQLKEAREKGEGILARAETAVKNDRALKSTLKPYMKTLEKALKGKDTVQIRSAAEELEKQLPTE